MGKTALLVDDSRVARITLKKLLIANAFDVIEVGSGEEAIAHLDTGAARPDIIFMDVMMGGIDGLTATRQIKSDPRFSDIPVVICTGNDSDADISHALDTGAMGVLSKPPAADGLAKVLSDYEQLTALSLEPEVIPSPIEMPEPVSAPPAESPSLDQDALVQQICGQIEAQLRTDFERTARTMAEDISRQVAEQTAEEIVEKQVKVYVESITPQISEFLMPKVIEQAAQMAEQSAKQASREVVVKSAEKAVQQVASDLDLGTMAFDIVATEGKTWLQHQQQAVQAQLLTEVQQAVAPAVQTQVEQALSSLPGKVHDIVSQQLAEYEAAETRDPALEKHEAAISRLNSLVIVLGLGLVAIAGGLGLLLI